MTEVAREKIVDFVHAHEFTADVECDATLHDDGPMRAIWYARHRCCDHIVAMCAVCVGRSRSITSAKTTAVSCHLCGERRYPPMIWDLHLVELIRIKGAS